MFIIASQQEFQFPVLSERTPFDIDDGVRFAVVSVEAFDVIGMLDVASVTTSPCKIKFKFNLSGNSEVKLPFSNKILYIPIIIVRYTSETTPGEAVHERDQKFKWTRKLREHKDLIIK